MTKEFKDLQRKYKETLFDILGHRSGKVINDDWQEFQYIADEILSVLFDERELPFEMSDEEHEILHQFMADEFYFRKFGDK